MGAIDTQYTFTATDTITSAKMNNIIDQTSITEGAILGTTLEVAAGKLKIRSAGITSNEIGANSIRTIAIEDFAVTPAKLSNSDFGDFTVASGVATIDANAVTFTKLATAAVATVAEVKAEAALKLVTADNVKQSPAAAKAYGSFTVAPSSRVLSGAYNTASVTRVDSDNTTVLFTSSMSTSAYTVVCQTTNSGTTGPNVDGNPTVHSKTITGFKITHVSESAGRAIDFVVFGTLA